MPRTKTSVCTVPGCTQPRMIGKHGREQTKCEAHMREYWRQKQAEKHHKAAVVEPPRPAQSSTCWLCGHTAAEAARLALHVGCYCCTCTPMSTPQAELERRAYQPAAAQPSANALLIDAQAQTVQHLAIAIIDSEPLPAPAELRLRVLEAERDGIPVLRRHLVTKEISHE